MWSLQSKTKIQCSLKYPSTASRYDPINRSIEEERRVQVLVRDNNVDQALKVLKKKMQREGNVGPLRQPSVAGRQRHHLSFRDHWHGLEVERGERLAGGQIGRASCRGRAEI